MEQGAEQVSSFPLPPAQYWEQYSDEKVSNGEAPPPPPPIDGHYRMFGESQQSREREGEPLLPGLESLGLQKLYRSSGDARQELKRLTRSLVAAFLDLLEILVRCPDSPERGKKVRKIPLAHGLPYPRGKERRGGSSFGLDFDTQFHCLRGVAKSGVYMRM